MHLLLAGFAKSFSTFLLIIILSIIAQGLLLFKVQSNLDPSWTQKRDPGGLIFPHEVQNSLLRCPHFPQNFVVSESLSLHSGLPQKMYFGLPGSDDFGGGLGGGLLWVFGGSCRGGGESCRGGGCDCPEEV